MMGPPEIPAALSFVGFLLVESAAGLFIAVESAVARVGVVL